MNKRVFVTYENVSQVGSCNACSYGDENINLITKVFVINLRGIEIRLCQKHWHEMLKEKQMSIDNQ